MIMDEEVRLVSRSPIYMGDVCRWMEALASMALKASDENSRISILIGRVSLRVKAMQPCFL